MKAGNYALNERLFPMLEKNQLAVGVAFAYMGQEVEHKIEFKGNNYKRLHTECIPSELTSDFCSIQIYEKIETKL